MKAHEIASWGEVRARGRARFILINGLLLWGLPLFVVMTFILDPSPRSPGMIVSSAVGWLLSGLLYGPLLWHINERRYRKTIGEGHA